MGVKLTVLIMSAKKNNSGFAATAEPFVAGGMAACLASSVVHPMDLAKTRLQLSAMNSTGPPPGIVSMLTTIQKTEGISGLYAGISASLLRQATYGTARIGLFRVISDKAQTQFDGPLPFWAKTACGMAGGAMAVIVGTPCDVALVRMQADSMKPVAERRNYSSVFNALGRIASE
jgi:solute carrier family 25 oxoglutarate transporter 11